MTRRRNRALPRTSPRDATLVVIEFGASWPRWLDPGRSGDVVVVAQHYEGHPSSLVLQVANRITRVEASGWRLERVIFVANDRTDGDANAARSVLVRSLVARMEEARLGWLTLTIGGRASNSAREALQNLADTLRAAARLGVVIDSSIAGWSASPYDAPAELSA